MQVVSISDPTSLHVVKKVSLPNVSGSYPGGLSIFYYNQRVYVGVHRTAGHEFHIYDVKDPTSLTWLSSIELNHNINHVIIRGNYAFLATSGNTKSIIILDISNPAKIKEVSSLAFLGNEDTLSLFVSGNLLFAGRAKGTQTTHPEFYIINIANPVAPQVLGSYKLNKSVTGIQFYNNLAFLSLTGSPSEIKILKIEDPQEIQLAHSFTVPQAALVLDYEDKKLITLLKNGSYASLIQ